MFKSVKLMIIALLAIAAISGCQGPPRPGFSKPYGNPYYNNDAAAVANAKAEAAVAKAEAKAAKAEAAAAKAELEAK